MIQCDTCKCWQHGPCVGLWDEKVRWPRSPTGVGSSAPCPPGGGSRVADAFLTLSHAGVPQSLLLRAVQTQPARARRVSPSPVLAERAPRDLSPRPLKQHSPRPSTHSRAASSAKSTASHPPRRGGAPPLRASRQGPSRTPRRRPLRPSRASRPRAPPRTRRSRTSLPSASASATRAPSPLLPVRAGTGPSPRSAAR